MKKFAYTLCALFAVTGLTTPAFSQGRPPAGTVNPEGNVAEALAKIQFISEEKPSATAQFYILLESGSWCGPCRAEMPEICKMYEEMKADGRVELILISSDRSKEAALKFRDDNKGTFAVTMPTKEACELPGKVTPRGVPHMTLVDANGKKITDGHGSKIRQWKSLTIEAPAAE